MHFIKLILFAIVCELLACFGISSDQDKVVKTIPESESVEPITVIYNEPAEVIPESAPETVYILEI